MNRLSRMLCCSISLGAVIGAAVGCQSQLPPPNVATAPPSPNCRSVITNDLDNSAPIAIPDKPGVNLTGRRLATWARPGLRSTGKWAGIVARHAGDNAADKPQLISVLSPGDTGCLFFIERADGPPLGRHADAFVQKSDNSPPYRLKAALICYHLIEHGDPPPTYESAADNCPEGTTAVGSIGLTDRFEGIRVPLHFTVEADGFEAALRRQLAAFLPALRGTALDDIVRLLVAPGPWFPCELNGCCRAF